MTVFTELLFLQGYTTHPTALNPDPTARRTLPAGWRVLTGAPPAAGAPEVPADCAAGACR